MAPFFLRARQVDVLGGKFALVGVMAARIESGDQVGVCKVVASLGGAAGVREGWS